MRWSRVLSASIAIGLAACGQPSGPSQAEAQAAAQPAEGGPAAILSALRLAPDAEGRIVNECGDKVKPSIVAAELGGAVGTAQLVAIGGGPTAPACYGDGPDLHLMRAEAGGYREIYAARGRMLIILATSHDGVRDLADGGPGFSFPVWEWNGSEYADAGRSVSDAEIANATFLP